MMAVTSRLKIGEKECKRGDSGGVVATRRDPWELRKKKDKDEALSLNKLVGIQLRLSITISGPSKVTTTPLSRC